MTASPRSGRPSDISVESKRRIFIAGPMSHYPEFNFPAFNEVADRCRALGWHVENPADNGVTEGYRWEDYLRDSLTQLVTCQYIYMLPGWQDSNGAQLELYVAKALGLTVMMEIR